MGQCCAGSASIRSFRRPPHLYLQQRPLDPSAARGVDIRRRPPPRPPSPPPVGWQTSRMHPPLPARPLAVAFPPPAPRRHPPSAGNTSRMHPPRSARPLPVAFVAGADLLDAEVAAQPPPRRTRERCCLTSTLPLSPPDSWARGTSQSRSHIARVCRGRLRQVVPRHRCRRLVKRKGTRRPHLCHGRRGRHGRSCLHRHG